MCSKAFPHKTVTPMPTSYLDACHRQADSGRVCGGVPLAQSTSGLASMASRRRESVLLALSFQLRGILVDILSKSISVPELLL